MAITHKDINLLTQKATITSTSSNQFAYLDYNLQELPNFIPTGQTSMSNNFYQCWSLPEVTVPAAVTSIGASTFQYCYGLKVLRCLPTTPPTITELSGIPSDCVIQVPSASLAAYQAASIWSTYASQMVGAWTISLALTNVSSSNKTPMVGLNESYTTTLTPNNGNTLGTVTVKMGGTDITSTAYSAGVVTIASVTGNIEISASAS